jgi:hypothetical protein
VLKCQNNSRGTRQKPIPRSGENTSENLPVNLPIRNSNWPPPAQFTSKWPLNGIESDHDAVFTRTVLFIPLRSISSPEEILNFSIYFFSLVSVVQSC